MEKVLQQISKEAGPGSTFLEHLEAQILKIYLLGANHGGTFLGSKYIPVCPKNSEYVNPNGDNSNRLVTFIHFTLKQVTTFVLLNVTGREFFFFDFFEKYKYLMFFLGSGLNFIFQRPNHF